MGQPKLMRFLTILAATVFLFAGSAGQAAESDSGMVNLSGIKRVVAISDVHGALFQLLDTLEACRLIARRPEHPLTEAAALKILGPRDYDRYLTFTGRETVLVFCGDYVARGDWSREVLDLILFLEKEAGQQGGQVIALPGNHEIHLLDGRVFETSQSEENTEEDDPLRESFKRLTSVQDGTIEELLSAKGFYGSWLRKLPMAARVNDVFFVHAGLPSRVRLNQVLDSFLQARSSENWLADIFQSDTSPVQIRKFLQGGKKKKSWWKKSEEMDRLLAELDCHYLVFGHDPGAFGEKGKIGVRDGRIFNIDTGMTPLKGYSAGSALEIDFTGLKPRFTAVEASEPGDFQRRLLETE